MRVPVPNKTEGTIFDGNRFLEGMEFTSSIG
jgi:hypothetical protein